MNSVPFPQLRFEHGFRCDLDVTKRYSKGILTTYHAWVRINSAAFLLAYKQFRRRALVVSVKFFLSFIMIHQVEQSRLCLKFFHHLLFTIRVTMTSPDVDMTGARMVIKSG